MSQMTSAEIEQKIQELQKKLEETRASEVQELKTKVEDYAKSLGTSISELFPNTKSKSANAKKQSRVLYIDDEGNAYGRALKDWSEAEKAQFKKNKEQSLK